MSNPTPIFQFMVQYLRTKLHLDMLFMIPQATLQQVM